MAATKNRLIEMLPLGERRHFLSQCELVDLLPHQILEAPGRATSHLHFPVDGFVALLTELDQHPGMEVGVVGREGMLGLHLALGQPLSLLRTQVQGRGAAWRIPGPAFARELARSRALRQCLDRYLCVHLAQLAIAAGCQRFHLIAPRLARWLLMRQDRALADSFHITHEQLAQMLGVRREGVTTAAGALQRARMIEYHRGELTVRDRGALEAAACSCYAADQGIYSRLLHRKTGAARQRAAAYRALDPA